ncbi:MAG TPA: hypothetical protein ENN13_03370 [Candidatus Altiarchaeales archaeon]|nr:hypothetical protein [Candidatus Altiarchaeales archaeon]
MIVGIVMWQLGIFNPGAATATNMQGFGAVKPQLTACGLQADGQIVSCAFLNAAGTPITITHIKMSVDGGPTISKDIGQALSPNQHYIFDYSSIPGVSGRVGDSFQLNAEVTYTIQLGADTVQRKSSGRITGPLE